VRRAPTAPLTPEQVRAFGEADDHYERLICRSENEMDEDKWRAFTFDFLRRHIGKMHDDATPQEIVDWLLLNWPKEQPSRDEVLRHLLENVAAQLKDQLPTWWQIHQGDITKRNPYEFERRVTPRPPGAGLFVDSMDELRDEVVRRDMEQPRPRWMQ
jgi:hypothetical protein